MFAELPKGVSTPELKIAVAEGEHYRFIEEFVAKAKFEGARVATIDGVRADWPDGWGLVRASNTTPSLVLRFDAKDADALARVQAAVPRAVARGQSGAEAAVLAARQPPRASARAARSAARGGRGGAVRRPAGWPCSSR